MGSQLGIVLAALVLVVAPEIGRSFAEYRMLLGAGMIAIMVWRPAGYLVPIRRPSILLRHLTARLDCSPPNDATSPMNRSGRRRCSKSRI